VQNISKVI